MTKETHHAKLLMKQQARTITLKVVDHLQGPFPQLPLPHNKITFRQASLQHTAARNIQN